MNTPARKVPVKLSTKESYELCHWLNTRKLKPDDTHSSLAREASNELQNERLNPAHVAERIRQLELQIPTSATHDLESDIVAVAKLVMVLAQHSSAILPRTLTEQVNEIANSR